MGKCLIILVNGHGVVTQENEIKVKDFPLWRERISELEKIGWEISRSDQNDETGITKYYLERVVNVTWEYRVIYENGNDDPVELNNAGDDGWELVSSVGFMIDNFTFIKHFLKRPKKT